LGVAPQTVRRLLAELPEGFVVSAGQTRRLRYALRRPLRGALEEVPVYAIDRHGQAAPLAPLSLIQPQGALLQLYRSAWPVPAESNDGWWDGLPYPVYGVRPTGYMGRRFARVASEALGVPENPDTWSDDDIVWVLSQRGIDVSGNLILGEVAYNGWFRDKLRDRQPHPARGLARTYARLAEESVAMGEAGSSAAGEFPKFTTMREQDGAATPHVLVKFSGGGGSAPERRWSDLLVCEHLALECLKAMTGVSPARSRILAHGGRTFIEVERFDRVGMHGRLALCGLDAIEPTFVGTRETAWPAVVRNLEAQSIVEAGSASAVDVLWWFGRQIGNTDMHAGNLSFHVDRKLRLAPAYDMLPMAYAPLAGGELPARDFHPAIPLPQERDAWLRACGAAVAFWKTASDDARISGGFRAICRANGVSLRALAERL
jgi:hypothetical protein